MSLIRRSPISARQLAANRRSAQQSTGPRTPEGKENSRFNGLKHGLSAGPFRRVMTELGEDPEEFDQFHEGLRESTEPANTLEAQLVEDLALLWWKKRRSERAQAGLQAHEVEQRRRVRERARYEAERLTVDQSEEENEARGLLRAPDSRGKFQLALGWLGWLIGRLERHQGWREGKHTLDCLYGKEPTVRGREILGRFWDLQSADPARPDGQASGKAQPGADGETSGLQDGADGAQQAVEASAKQPESERAGALRAELIGMLGEERGEVAEGFRLFRRQHEELSEAAQDACLAPTDPRWTWILRLDNYLDRQIERKIRLLDMLQEKRRKRQASEAAPAPPPPARTPKMKIQSRKTVEKNGVAFGSQARKKPTTDVQRPISDCEILVPAPSG